MQRAVIGDEIWHYLLSLSRGGTASAPPPEIIDQQSALDLYLPLAERGRFVLAQVGQSLDGRVATPSGDARDVSGQDGIAHLHRCRALADAVVVGVGTVVADDPSLSVRAVSGKSPVRVVIDCNGRMPEWSRMLHDGGMPVIVIQSEDAPPPGGIQEVIRLPRKPDGGLCPRRIVEALGARGLTRLLIEGGANTMGRFLQEDLLDRLHVSIAPLIIGSGPAGIRLPPIDRLTEARRPRVKAYDIGSDIVFDCELKPRTEGALTSASEAAALMEGMA